MFQSITHRVNVYRAKFTCDNFERLVNRKWICCYNNKKQGPTSDGNSGNNFYLLLYQSIFIGIANLNKLLSHTNGIIFVLVISLLNK